jgi:hypothetical protein
VCFGVLCFAAVAVAVAAARAGGHTDGSPVYLPGGWHTVFVAAVAVAFGSYLAGLLLLARQPGWPAPVIALVVAIQLTPLAAPLLLSTDARTYNALGTLPDPFSARRDFGGGETYGPLWQLVSQPLARLDGGQPDTEGYSFRVLAAICVLAIVWLVWQLTTRKVLAVAIIGWNPFVALHFSGGGHNDALMMMFVMAALFAGSRGASRVGGALWATSVALKWSSAWFLALWAIERFRRRKPTGWTGLLLAASAFTLLAFAVYGPNWLYAFRNLSQQEGLDHPSLGVLGWLEDAGLSKHPALAAVTLFEIGIFVVLACAAWRQRLRLGMAAGLLVLAAPRIDPWYALWPISLAAADDEDRWGRLLAVALSGFFLLDAVSHLIDA